MAGFDNDVVYADNVDFSGGSPVSGKILLDGQLLIGSTALNAGGTHINVGTLTAGTGIAITNGPGSIIIENTGGGGGGGGGTNTLVGNTGSATQVAGIINVIGSTGLTSSGSGNTLTFSPANDLAALEALSGTGYLVRTGVETYSLRTFLAGTGIGLSNADGVAGATTISASAAVPTTFTSDSGVATPAANNLNVLGTSTQGVSTSGAGSTLTLTVANASAIQKGVASFDATNFTVTTGAVTSNNFTITAGVGLSGGGALTLGGSTTIDLEVPVIVANGGTGLTSITQNGVLYGNATSPVGVTSPGTNGQVLIGGTGVAPAFATIAGTQGVTLTGGSNTLSIGLVNVPNSALANSSITITAGSGIAVVGSPVSLGGAVTISATGALPTQFTTDSGVAIPSGNNLNIIGTSAQGISSSGTGSTVTLTIANASTSQKGVLALATNAEAIAGTDTAKSITSDDLKAKLGVQTLHGFALGTGTTSAVGWTAEPTNGQLPIGSTGNAPVLNTLTAGTGISITNAAGSITVTNTSPATASSPITTKFTASGTWTKATSPSPSFIQIIAWGGGAGGGSGRKGAAGSTRYGGGGGAGGQFVSYYFDASVFSASETVTIGATAAGGISQSTNSTNGNPGIAGNDTSIGTQVIANGGNFGSGGSTFDGTAGLAQQIIYNGAFSAIGSGATSSGGGGNGGAAAGPTLGSIGIVNMFSGGGGGGGGISNGNVEGVSAAGGANYKTDASTVKTAGGTAGAGGGGTGGNGGNLATDYFTYGATGGGGGGPNLTGNAGTGGNGGTPGGGGGGGGASVNSVGNSGAGGIGARGELWVIEYF